jgi:hypothetical protein
MRPFRANLTDDGGQLIAEVEGLIESPEEAAGTRRGRFEFQEIASFIQSVMEGKTFGLHIDDGSQLAIMVDSVSASATPGYSEAEFSSI